jgi:hypothetical protein
MMAGTKGANVRQRISDVRLDALLAERDNLKIRINLIEDMDVATGGSAAKARTELAALEKEIAGHKRAAGA